MGLLILYEHLANHLLPIDFMVNYNEIQLLLLQKYSSICNRILQYCNSVLLYCNRILKYCNHILWYCKSILQYWNSILRYCKSILQYWNSILQYCNSILQYCNSILQYTAIVLLYWGQWVIKVLKRINLASFGFRESFLSCKSDLWSNCRSQQVSKVLT